MVRRLALFALLATLVVPAGHATAAAPRCHGKPATQYLTSPGILTGTSGDDVIVGSDGADTINGLGGNDLICGRDGNDTIVPGPGNDTVYAGRGDDKVTFSVLGDLDGNDTLYGEGGADVIADTAGANVAHGGPGSDFVTVTGKAYGDSGDDPAIVAQETSPGARNAFASGGSGSDGGVTVIGGVADGGSGNDYVVAALAGDTANGSSGSDRLLDISTGVVTLNGGSAADTCDVSGAGDTTISCETVV